MTEKFEIGEVAIYVGPDEEWHGREVTIVSNLQPPQFRMSRATGELVWSSCGYLVDVPSKFGGIPFARVEWLRKKKPPQREIDQVTTWDKCAWKPREVEHA